MSDPDAAAPAEPVPCPPCGGKGQVLSKLGLPPDADPVPVECPWCDGTGVFTPEHDSQARWREDDGERGT